MAPCGSLARTSKTTNATQPKAATIVRRITGRVRLYARVFELVGAKR